MFTKHVTALNTVDLESHLLLNCALERFRARRVVSNNVTALNTVDLESRLLQNCAYERSRTRMAVSNNMTTLNTVDLESRLLQNCAYERSRTRMAVSGQQQRDCCDHRRFRITFTSKCLRERSRTRRLVSNNVTFLNTVDLRHVHTLPNSFCAATKIMLDRASVHIQQRLWRRAFCDGAKLRRADRESEA